MANERLPVAVVGLGAFGRRTLEALTTLDCVEVVGAADSEPERCAEVEAALDLPTYTDNRSLLAERRPRAVYLSIPPMQAPDLIRRCAEREIHVWKELPLARNLAEGADLVRRLESAGLKLVVGTQRRFNAAYRRAFEQRDRLERVFLARAHYLFNWSPALAWRADKASAGGGALLELGYQPIDLLIRLLGLPEEVYGAAAGGHRIAEHAPSGEPLPPYDTDDTAAGLLTYARGCMASVVTTRFSGPVSEELTLHGRAGSLTCNSERCLLRDPDGRILDQVVEDAAPGDIFRRQGEAFARAVLDEAEHYECSGRENLLTLAVIEALYLSTRTHQPETPQRLLSPHDFDVESCLALRPPSDGDGADAPEQQRR